MYVDDPVFLGLFLVDRAIKENNGKTGLIGLFNNFNIADITKPSPPFQIWASVTNVSGELEFAINLVREDSPNVLLSIGGELKAEDPEAPLELVFAIPGVQFPKYGKYNLTLSVDNSTIGSRIVNVTQIKPPTTGE